MAQVKDLDAGAARVVIESAWGAGFHWIAFGCEAKDHKHQNNHTRLGRFLRDLGEDGVAKLWEDLDNARQGGWYGGEPDSDDAQWPLTLLAQIRLWATGLKAPREVDVMFTSRTSQEWDPTFIANVKRDGIILFQRGELPEAFAA